MTASRKKRLRIAAALLFLLGLGLVCYPVLSNWARNTLQSIDSQRYGSEQSQPNPSADASLEELYRQMQAYNKRLYSEGQKLTDPFAYEQPSFDLKQFGLPDNIVGYLSIPKLGVQLPVYLGASRENLRKGAAHLSQTSLPIGGADTTLIPAEDENCLSWLFGSKDKITMPYLNIKGQGLKRNVTLDLEDCLVGITYTELGSIGSYVSASAAQQAWKAQAVAIHSYLEYHKQYGSQAVKDEVLVYNGSVCDAVWSASAGYNTQTGVYGTCASLDAWGTDVPYLQSVESPYEEQYHKLLRRVIGKDYTYIEYNDSRTGEPYQSADTTHKDLGGFVQYNTLVSNGRSYRYINQFVSSRYCFDFGTDASGTPCMTYYGYGHGVGMSQCGAVGYAAEEGMNYKQILQHYYTGAKIRTSTTRSGGLFGWLAGLFR